MKEGKERGITSSFQNNKEYVSVEQTIFKEAASIIKTVKQEFRRKRIV
jgi:hypothetical protein